MVSDKKASGENEKINVPLSPTISIGDTNLNGYKDIVVSGINGGSFLSDDNVLDCPALDGKKIMMVSYSDSGKETDSLVRGVCESVDMPPGLKTDGYNHTLTYPVMGTTAVAVNGPANYVYVFSGGRMYDFASGTGKFAAACCRGVEDAAPYGDSKSVQRNANFFVAYCTKSGIIQQKPWLFDAVAFFTGI